MSITTKKGDFGMTDIKGKRLSKSDPLMHLIGHLDEISSQIILLQARYKLNRSIYEPIVNDIYRMSSYLTGYIDSIDLDEAIFRFEDFIALKKDKTHAFIFPFDDELKANYHLLRAQIRTLERYCVEYSQLVDINKDILKYLNRLSDFIFAQEL